ncbi:MAG: hypothetical protein ABIQ40_00605 [Bacteroidia bacterium]
MIKLFSELKSIAEIKSKSAHKVWTDAGNEQINLNWSLGRINSTFILVLEECDFIGNPFYTIE